MNLRRLGPTGLIGVAIALAAACGSSSTADPSTDDPAPSAPADASVQGSWRTSTLTAAQVIAAYEKAGGSPAAARAFFHQLGGGARHHVVIGIELEGNRFEESEGADQNPADETYLATYQLEGGSRLHLHGGEGSDTCDATYTYQVSASQLRLHVLKQCSGGDAIPSTTLFASFPFARAS